MRIILMLLLVVACGKYPVNKVDSSKSLAKNYPAAIIAPPVYPKYSTEAFQKYCAIMLDNCLEDCKKEGTSYGYTRCLKRCQEILPTTCTRQVCAEQCSTLSLTSEQIIECNNYCPIN